MENPFPKNNQQPTLEHIMALFENETLSAIITGHLIIESLLDQFIELKGGKSVKNTFSEKVEKCVTMEFFDENLKEYLLTINRVRNNFAHNLGYKFTFSDCFELVKKAGEAGIDFSDETIFLNKSLSEQWYGNNGVIQELFQNTAMDLSFIIEDHGGKFSFS